MLEKLNVTPGTIIGSPYVRRDRTRSDRSHDRMSPSAGQVGEEHDPRLVRDHEVRTCLESTAWGVPPQAQKTGTSSG